MSQLPEGFIPVMLTPFTPIGQVDFKGLVRLTDMYIQKGAKGLFANCLSSEMYELSEQERLDVVKTVVETAAVQSIALNEKRKCYVAWLI